MYTVLIAWFVLLVTKINILTAQRRLVFFNAQLDDNQTARWDDNKSQRDDKNRNIDGSGTTTRRLYDRPIDVLNTQIASLRKS